MVECPSISETIFGYTMRVSERGAFVPEIVEPDLRAQFASGAT